VTVECADWWAALWLLEHGHPPPAVICRCPDCPPLPKTEEYPMTDQPYDSTADTLRHSLRVGTLMGAPIRELVERSTQHDISKTEEPEVGVFNEFTPKLKTSTYGSDEYKGFLTAMGEGLAHHYASNRHHPEFGEPGMEWRSVGGYEGYYEVSNFGDVRSLGRVVPRSGAKGDLTRRGQTLKANVTPKGYLRLQLVRDQKHQNFLVHRLVAGDPFEVGRQPSGQPRMDHRERQPPARLRHGVA